MSSQSRETPRRPASGSADEPDESGSSNETRQSDDTSSFTIRADPTGDGKRDLVVRIVSDNPLLLAFLAVLAFLIVDAVFTGGQVTESIIGLFT